MATKRTKQDTGKCLSCLGPAWKWAEGFCKYHATRAGDVVGVAIGFDELEAIVGEDAAQQVIKAGRLVSAQDL